MGLRVEGGVSGVRVGCAVVGVTVGLGESADKMVGSSVGTTSCKHQANVPTTSHPHQSALWLQSILGCRMQLHRKKGQRPKASRLGATSLRARGDKHSTSILVAQKQVKPLCALKQYILSTSRFVAYASLVMWKRVLLGPRGNILYLIMTIICNTYVIWQVAIRPQASLNTLVIMRILVTITACRNM